jgi:hypothetical protein
MELDMSAWNSALQFCPGSGSDNPTLVQDGDLDSQPVGLVEVLCGEQAGDSPSRQIADYLPHSETTSRVETPSHPTRIGRQCLVGGISEVEFR